MKLQFSKYQGTGNDFVMIDNLDGQYNGLSIEQIQFLCNRKLGVGADGLIRISKDNAADFYVDYFNADGSQSFCGNGARCSVAFAKELGIIETETTFNAIDGRHTAFIEDGIVRLEMLPVADVQRAGGDYCLNTGSPHFVHLAAPAERIDIVEYGKKIRYSASYIKEGINVNVMRELEQGVVSVETYERGVEDETRSCGTGVTACALVYKLLNPTTENVTVQTKGGILHVEGKRMQDGFSDIWLSGPAVMVFGGEIYV